MQAPKIDFHQWYIVVAAVAGLASVALTMLAEIIDKAKVVYIKIRNFKKSDDPSGMAKPSP
jgi:hypothetical protein